MNLSVLYRGPLTSCNYRCGYCPFAKRVETEERLQRDQCSLIRFTDWLQEQSTHRWRILLTPWGEALVRAWYRRAVALLTHVPHVESVAVQTNLYCGLGWINECQIDRLALWATYHPTETRAETFVRKVQSLRESGVRICAGMVAVPDSIDEITAMRRRLPSDVYLWVNAQQPRRRPYTADEVDRLTAIDPQFPLTLRRQPSYGNPCRTGEVTFTVDGAGNMRRCHFVDEVIGNIHDAGWERALRPRRCPNRFCDCFLGKAQMQADSLAPFFGDSLLERLPATQHIASDRELTE